MKEIALNTTTKGNPVPFRYALIGLILALGGAALPLHIARADTTLIDSSGIIEGAQSFTQGFDITSAGTLTVTLSDVPWLDTISGLGVFLTTPSGLVGTSMGAGTESVAVQPGMIYAHWFGDASGAYGAGVYGLNIEFQPAASAIPLPKSLILFLSGLGILFGWQRCTGSTTESRPTERAMTI